MKTVIEMARKAGFLIAGVQEFVFAQSSFHFTEELKAFAELVRADERETISDEWSMCVQSDLEHGLKSLNEQAAKDWFKNYPEIAKFGAWLESRGQA